MGRRRLVAKSSNEIQKLAAAGLWRLRIVEGPPLWSFSRAASAFPINFTAPRTRWIFFSSLTIEDVDGQTGGGQVSYVARVGPWICCRGHAKVQVAVGSAIVDVGLDAEIGEVESVAVLLHFNFSKASWKCWWAAAILSMDPVEFGSIFLLKGRIMEAYFTRLSTASLWDGEDPRVKKCIFRIEKEWVDTNDAAAIMMVEAWTGIDEEPKAFIIIHIVPNSLPTRLLCARFFPMWLVGWLVAKLAMRGGDEGSGECSKIAPSAAWLER